MGLVIHNGKHSGYFIAIIQSIHFPYRSSRIPVAETWSQTKLQWYSMFSKKGNWRGSKAQQIPTISFSLTNDSAEPNTKLNCKLMKSSDVTIAYRFVVQNLCSPLLISAANKLMNEDWQLVVLLCMDNRKWKAVYCCGGHERTHHNGKWNPPYNQLWCVSQRSKQSSLKTKSVKYEATCHS